MFSFLETVNVCLFFWGVGRWVWGVGFVAMGLRGRLKLCGR